MKLTNLSNVIGRTHLYWGRKPLANLFEIFNDCKKGDIVLDPFCGGGNCLIPVIIQGARIIASDLNPMATFLTRVLVRPINIALLKSHFEDLSEKVETNILESYFIKCPDCKKRANIRFLVWSNKSGKDKPEAAHIDCNHCGLSELIELSAPEKNRQIRWSQESPRSWFPKNRIHSTRESPVKYHYELFTGRNLSMLSELFKRINQVSDDIYREAFYYVFTSILYSCSKMQMHTEEAPSSLRGWTARRFYVPTQKKEQNVWKVFERRFNNFLNCKKQLNSLIPHVRITDSPQKFLAGDYEALVFKADVFDLPAKLLNRADRIFLDPPYVDDIDYPGFSEFWGAWLKMTFNFGAEWQPRKLKSEGLDKLLKTMRRHTHKTSIVTLALGPKKPNDWKLESCITNSGYFVDEERWGHFHYDNSQRRRGKTGIDKACDQYYTLVRKKPESIIVPAQGRHLKISEQQDIRAYLRVTVFINRESKYGPEKIKELTFKIIPKRLHQQLINTKIDEIKSYTKSELDNRRAYYTFCYSLLKRILSEDNWKIGCVKNNNLENNVFGVRIRETSIERYSSLIEYGIFFAKKHQHTILFYFDNQQDIILKEISRRILKEDHENFKLINVLIVSNESERNEWRKVTNADVWPRGFFICFEEIISLYKRICPDEYQNLFSAHYSPEVSTVSQKKYSGVAAFKAEVINNVSVGVNHICHYKLRFQAPQLRNALPGQFVMMDTKPRKPIYKTKIVERKELKDSLNLKSESFLKRPFSIYRMFYPNFKPNYLKNLRLPPNLATIMHTVCPNEFDVFFKVIEDGVGTPEMTRLKKGDKIQMIGPLGKGFNLRDLRCNQIKEVHIIGGGVGMAPLIFLVQALRYYSFKIKVFIGIESMSQLKYTNDVNDDSYGEESKDAYIYVDDLLALGVKRPDIFVSYDKEIGECKRIIPKGNYSEGFVSNQYENHLKKSIARVRQDEKHSLMAFACGPMPMMKAVRRITNRYSIPLKVYIEKRMACGIGVCLSCVCKTKDDKGEEQYSRVCTEGPIFDAANIVW